MVSEVIHGDAATVLNAVQRLIGRGVRPLRVAWERDGIMVNALSRDDHVVLRLEPDAPRRGRNAFVDPPGMAVALLGPDGTGKSTVAAECARRLRPSFVAVRQQHLRPGLLPDLKVLLDPRKWLAEREPVDVTDPHGQPPSGMVGSWVRAAYYSMDYVVGYWPVVRGATRRGELVIFDRYHADLFADPRRWRIALPPVQQRGVRSLVTRAFPQPELTVLLEGPASELRARKPELPIEEIERQAARYREVAAASAHVAIVSVADSVERVVDQVVDAIANRQAERVLSQLRRGLTGR